MRYRGCQNRSWEWQDAREKLERDLRKTRFCPNKQRAPEHRRRFSLSDDDSNCWRAGGRVLVRLVINYREGLQDGQRTTEGGRLRSLGDAF